MPLFKNEGFYLFFCLYTNKLVVWKTFLFVKLPFNSVDIQPILRYNEILEGHLPPCKPPRYPYVHRNNFTLNLFSSTRAPQKIITGSPTNRGINTQTFRNAAKNTKHPSKYSINSSLLILHINWATSIEALLQINFLNNNLAVNELRSPLSTFSGPSTFSQEGVHWYMENYFRHFSLAENLKNTVINYGNVNQQLLKAIPLRRKTEWRNIWNPSD